MIMNNMEGAVGAMCKPVARFTEWERKSFDSYLAFIILTSYFWLLQGNAWYCDTYSTVKTPIYRTVNLARLFQWRFPRLFHVQATSVFLPYYALHIRSTSNAQTA
jgi:hypothetical protein